LKRWLPRWVEVGLTERPRRGPTGPWAEIENQRGGGEGTGGGEEAHGRCRGAAQRDMFLVFARFEHIRSGDLRYLDPEGRREFYQALRLWAEVDRDGTVTLTGVFTEF
jgi:hypothetical protein